MGRLEGKTALVTASAQGMGRGIALCLAEEGADVMVSDLGAQEAGMKEVVSEIEAMGRRAAICATDVTDRGAVKALVDRTVETFGHLDITVANAGVSMIGPMLEARWEDVRKVFEITQFGVFHTCQFAARQMVDQVEAGRPGGKIVITGSVHEELSPENCAAYNMAKAAAVMLGRTLAVELAPHHINVNVVNPGWVDTPGSRGYVGDQVVDEGGRKIIWGRLGTTRDIGKAVVYLASDDADYVTGETLRVDGGFKVGMRLSERRGYEHT